MEIDVGAYIAALLYENETVAVPGLGGFQTAYQPSTIDHVQGQLHPPAKEVKLNTNLILDDGLLTGFIARKHNLSPAEAEQVVRDYVREVSEAIERREMVVLRGLGRLYKDFEHKLLLLPDHTNFNADSFGLPAISFYPLPRAERTASEPVRPAPVTEKADQVTLSISSLFQRYFWLVASLSVAVIGIGIWLIFFNGPREIHRDSLTDLPPDRLNVSPSTLPEEEASGQIPPAGETPAVQEEPEAPAAAEDVEAPTPAPDQRSCLIRIGVFGSLDNVERLVKRIYAEGFEPYTRELGSLTEVGVQFAYDDEQDIRRNLTAVQEKFEPKAKVIRK